jgi:hypothetical protein
MGSGPIHLVLDLYTAHHTDHIREVARQQGINLDRAVFGILKATARRSFHERCMQEPRLARRKADAVVDLIRSWDELRPELAVLGWEISEDPWDDATGEALL